MGKTKRVTVKNAKKVTWKVTKKAAKISVQMKNGKRSRRQTITVQVKPKRKLAKNTVSDAAAQTAQPTAVATEKTVFWRMMNPRFL